MDYTSVAQPFELQILADDKVLVYYPGHSQVYIFVPVFPPKFKDRAGLALIYSQTRL